MVSGLETVKLFSKYQISLAIIPKYYGVVHRYFCGAYFLVKFRFDSNGHRLSHGNEMPVVGLEL